MLQLFCDVESEGNVSTTEGRIKSLDNQKKLISLGAMPGQCLRETEITSSRRT
jgi:hypothetical protein